MAVNCDQIPEALRELNGCNTTSDANALGDNVVHILNGIIMSAGLVAVIFIIIGGINYMTSGGETAKLKKAKDTILYAAIGLVICVLSYSIVNWVIAVI